MTYLLESESQIFKEVVTSPETALWKEVINNEVQSILQNNAWELVDLILECKPLGYKWIFKRKMKVDGSIDKYKVRLVIKSYRQQENLDYFDTYSPITRINFIQMIIAITVSMLDKEIYMEQPKGFIAPGQEKKLCKLVKSFYGLKQTPK